MSWQAGVLPFIGSFAAGAEGSPAAAEDFGALLDLHHHQLKRMMVSPVWASVTEG